MAELHQACERNEGEVESRRSCTPSEVIQAVCGYYINWALFLVGVREFQSASVLAQVSDWALEAELASVLGLVWV